MNLFARDVNMLGHRCLRRLLVVIFLRPCQGANDVDIAIIKKSYCITKQVQPVVQSGQAAGLSVILESPAPQL
jgi:hypothetical protein